MIVLSVGSKQPRFTTRDIANQIGATSRTDIHAIRQVIRRLSHKGLITPTEHRASWERKQIRRGSTTGRAKDIQYTLTPVGYNQLHSLIASEEIVRRNTAPIYW